MLRLMYVVACAARLQRECWKECRTSNKPLLSKCQGRVVFSIRETYKLHRERLISIQNDVELLRWMVKGCKGTNGDSDAKDAQHIDADIAGMQLDKNCSPLSRFFNGVITDIFCRVAEHYGQNYGQVVKFIADWPCYNPEHQRTSSAPSRIKIVVRKR